MKEVVVDGDTSNSPGKEPAAAVNKMGATPGQEAKLIRTPASQSTRRQPVLVGTRTRQRATGRCKSILPGIHMKLKWIDTDFTQTEGRSKYQQVYTEGDFMQ